MNDLGREPVPAVADFSPSPSATGPPEGLQARRGRAVGKAAVLAETGEASGSGLIFRKCCAEAGAVSRRPELVEFFANGVRSRRGLFTSSGRNRSSTKRSPISHLLSRGTERLNAEGPKGKHMRPDHLRLGLDPVSQKRPSYAERLWRARARRGPQKGAA